MNNLQSEWSRLLVGGLVDAGVRHIVVSPGSRSTPLVLEAAHQAQKQEDVCLYDVVDERSAAYFALGQARVTGRPSLLICTSGTAGANYLPAVIEAEMAGVPLLVLTADRPVDLMGCGANQTIDQLKLYGDHVRRFFDLGQADGAARALRALRRTVSQAFLTSVHPNPGPVHLNARLVKPLEPRQPTTKDEQQLRAAVDALRGRRMPRTPLSRLEPNSELLDELIAACRTRSRGLIVAGPAPISQAAVSEGVVELSRRTGYPILADAASQLRYRGPRDAGAVFVDAFGLLMGQPAFRKRHQPDVILQIDRAPTAAPWDAFVEEAARDHQFEHWLLGPSGWNDPQSTATHRLEADLDALVPGLLDRLDEGPRETDWTSSLRDAEKMAQALIDQELATVGHLTEGGVARQLVDGLPQGALLMVGNSLSIRQVDLYGGGGQADVLVASQRGSSGIDGVTSGACGSATVGDRPTALLVGDVSFLHDLSGLASARHVRAPMAVIVVQNRGGRIFEMLPVATHPAAEGEVFDHWLTPHEYDFSHAAALFGLPFIRVGTSSELDEALRRVFEASGGTPGVTVIEAMVPPQGAIEQNRRLTEQLRLGQPW